MSLKAAQRLRPALAETTSEIKARPLDLPAGSAADGGRGVIVGIVDFGCHFAHQNFRNEIGSTRLLKLWDQNGSDGGADGFDYGTVYQAADINAALDEANPYSAHRGWHPRARADRYGVRDGRSGGWCTGDHRDTATQHRRVARHLGVAVISDGSALAD